MNYMINGWDELQRYRHDGHLTIDNMVAERAIRPFTVWRKNTVLFGSEDGVETTAAYFSVIETLRLCGVNIKDYLVDVSRAAIAGIKDYEAFDPAVYALKPAV